MTCLGQHYRTYALDFWGFGESDTRLESYAVDDFVRLLDEFMEQMGLDRVPIIGHSMGGTVALSVACRFPHRVSKVVIVGSPIVGSSLAFPLKLAGYQWAARALFTFFGFFRWVMRLASRWICADPRFPDIMDRDLSRTNLKSFLVSIASLRRTDLRSQLKGLALPVMGMFGRADNIVDPSQAQVLQTCVNHARIVPFQRAGHFIMLDEPGRFVEALKSFLDIPVE